MNITYRTAVSTDAAQLLDYLKTVGAQTENLTFGSEGLPFTLEQETALLARLENSPHSRFFLALDGEKIVGNACVNGNDNPRFRHRRSLAITVLRDYWGKGIGSGLMERMITFSHETGAELLSLEVRADNERAKALYRKFGFTSFGAFPKYFKFGGEYYDVDCMTLELAQDSTGGRELNALELYLPSPEDGWFYVKMLSDPATMAFNAPWFPPDGCIPNPEKGWAALQAEWIGKEPQRFYAYLRRKSDGAFVGDVNYHYNPERNWWDMGIVIYAPERGKGYGKQGLHLLLNRAFRVDGISRLHNEFERTRNAAYHIHKAFGFRALDGKDGICQLELTREEYLSKYDR